MPTVRTSATAAGLRVGAERGELIGGGGLLGRVGAFELGDERCDVRRSWHDSLLGHELARVEFHPPAERGGERRRCASRR